MAFRCQADENGSRPLTLRAQCTGKRHLLTRRRNERYEIQMLDRVLPQLVRQWLQFKNYQDLRRVRRVKLLFKVQICIHHRNVGQPA